VYFSPRALPWAVLSPPRTVGAKKEQKDFKNSFNSSVLPLWEELQVIQPSDKLKLFSTTINNLAKQYNWDELKQYQMEFEASIQAFDFEAIQLHIKNFKKFKAHITEIL